jgi:hypothetical protein
VADVIVTNLLGERDFVDEPTRRALASRGEGFRRALGRELQRRYAELAAELALSAELAADDLPGAIDRFCVRRTRDVPITWPRCAAALVWYVGTTELGDDRP